MTRSRRRLLKCDTGETVAALFLSVDDLDANPQFAPDPIHEERAVSRVSHRRGRDGDDALGPGAGGDRVKVAQRLHGTRHRFFAQALLFVDVAHQPQRRAGAGQQPEMPGAVLFEDDDAAGVRADVDNRNRGRMMVRANRRH